MPVSFHRSLLLLLSSYCSFEQLFNMLAVAFNEPFSGDRPSGCQRLSWAQLLARFFSYRCYSLPASGGRMRELVAILCGLQQCPGKALHHVKMRTNRGRA